MRPFLADDVLWHVGGNHSMSGDYVGIEAVIDYFRRVRKETAGTLRSRPPRSLANDRHASMLHACLRVPRRAMDGRAAGRGTHAGSNGRWTEYWALASDQDAVNAFWS